MDNIHGYMEHINGLYYPLYLYMLGKKIDNSLNSLHIKDIWVIY